MDSYNQTSSGIYIPTNYTIFNKPSELAISQRKLEQLKKIAEVKTYYQRNPIKFMRDIIGAELFDAQAYCLQMSWNKPNILWTCSRGYGKSSLVDLFIMSKGMLWNNHWSYIASGSGDQAILTFKTLENIANKNIESMTGLTGFFKHEIEINNSGGDGFIHNPSGHYYNLYNGSFCRTLNSNVDRKRGARGNLVVFDECGFLDSNLLNVYAAFAIVNKDLKMGGNIDADTIRTLPKELANQLFYISSASSIDTPFYQKYRDFSKQMFLGDPNYFVADINCDVVIKGTVKGKIYPTGLLSQDIVDAELRINREKALREFYNQFTEDGGAGAIIKRALITRNSIIRPPVLHNTNNQRKFGLFYDPARSLDNSVVLIAELIDDPEMGYKLDIVNLINFSDLGLRKKTPMTTPNQIRALKEILIDYNGDADDYDNIECFMIDAGSGGGGVNIADFFFEDWKDKNGKDRHGLIDKVYSEEYVKRYPRAINKLRLMKPSEFKAEMFESLIKMMESDLITFPETYDNKGYLNIPEIDQVAMVKSIKEVRESLDKLNLPVEEYESRYEEELSKFDTMKTKVYKLNMEEEVGLRQIDLMKEEIVNICRTKREGNKDSFKLPAHKDADTGASEHTLHDDRAFVLAMCGYFLAQKRLESIRSKKKDKQDAKQFSYVRAPKKVTQF